MRRVVQFATGSLLLPASAFAHGEQVLGLPLGQMASLPVVLVAAFLLPLRRRRRLLFCAVAVAAAIGCWFITAGGFIGRNFGYGMTPWFVLGIAPPIVAAVGAFLAFRRPSSLSKDEKA